MKHRKKKSGGKERSGSAAASLFFEKGRSELKAGDLAAAAEQFSRIPADSKHYALACKYRGNALLRLRRWSDAIPVLQAAHNLLPQDHEILTDAADAARLCGSLDIAATLYDAAEQRGADSYQHIFGKAALLQEQKQWLAAIGLWQQLAETYRDDPRVLHNLGKAWHELGETDRAVELMERSYALSGDATTLTMLAVLAPHAERCGHEQVKAIRVEAGQRLKANFPAASNTDRNVGQRVRIGYVSSFFHRPNWMKPVWALLNHHDRERFAIHLFTDSAANEIIAEGGYRPDERDKIYDIRELSNDAAAKLVADNGIDVLVDLNGYSVVSRLGLWARKPAPHTVGWFNYYATTGLPGIEWLIGDEVVIKPEEEQFYTEKILRLRQSYLTFQVGYDTPDVRLRADGEPFTFGCLGSGYKITPEVRAAWIRLLLETNGTRLLVRNRVLDDALHREWFTSFFTSAGVSPERLKLLGSAEHHEFLDTYGEVDLAIDTFPYNGGTTTMEALWQGVPLVCFSGDRWVSRTSATLLHSAGLNQFIGGDVNEYVEIAKHFSTGDRAAELRQMRSSMRQRLTGSQVCSGADLAANFEELILEIVAGRAEQAISS